MDGKKPPPAGPHAKPELTNPDATPGAGALPNPRSREVRRRTAGERQFRVSVGAPQSGGFRAKPVVIGLQCALATPQRVLVAFRLAFGDSGGCSVLPEVRIGRGSAVFAFMSGTTALDARSSNASTMNAE